MPDQQGLLARPVPHGQSRRTCSLPRSSLAPAADQGQGKRPVVSSQVPHPGLRTPGGLGGGGRAVPSPTPGPCHTSAL